MVVWAFNRTPIEASVIRDRNALYRVNYEGLVENPYTLSVINKTQTTMSYTISLEGLENAELNVPAVIEIEGGEMLQIPVTVIKDGYDLKVKATPISFTIESKQKADIKITKESYFYKN